MEKADPIKPERVYLNPSQKREKIYNSNFKKEISKQDVESKLSLSEGVEESSYRE